MKVKKAYHANPATTKTIMAMIGTIVIAIAPALVGKYPELALVLTTVGGVLGGGAYVRSPGTEPTHAVEPTEGE